jgi:hypothetical protein
MPVVGLTISIFYYAMILRNANKTQRLQLETRQAQMFYGVYNRMSQSDFVEAWNAFTSWKYTDYDELLETIADDKNRNYYMTLSVHFDGLGVLVRMGLVPIHFIAHFLPQLTRAYWEKQGARAPL